MPTKKTPAKKTAKKAPAKKAVKKTAKKAPKKSVKKDLVYAENQTSFWTTDGQILNSLVALRDAFESMQKEVYSHHVTKEKNDFSVWVETVLCDAECAASLQKAKTPKTAKTAVVKHLKMYSV